MPDIYTAHISVRRRSLFLWPVIRHGKRIQRHTGCADHGLWHEMRIKVQNFQFRQTNIRHPAFVHVQVNSPFSFKIIQTLWIQLGTFHVLVSVGKRFLMLVLTKSLRLIFSPGSVISTLFSRYSQSDTVLLCCCRQTPGRCVNIVQSFVTKNNEYMETRRKKILSTQRKGGFLHTEHILYLKLFCLWIFDLCSTFWKNSELNVWVCETCFHFNRLVMWNVDRTVWSTLLGSEKDFVWTPPLLSWEECFKP